jgi:predicted HTH transcriptional regulator
MKDPWDWEEQDIIGLIQDHVKENLSLDYKRSEALDKKNPDRKSDLSKDVSAFANSAGGTLIYGVEEKDNLPVRIDHGYDPADITREWIEHVIDSNIQRRIEGIRIKQIELTELSVGIPGRVMYVVHVPQSNRAPHMASNNIFYKSSLLSKIDYDVGPTWDVE